MIAYITGASSGLGAYTAQALVDTGWTVVAGARSFTGETDGRMTRLPLDVTRDDSVRDFMERAKQIGAPDAVIHCAAVLCFGSCEETAVADYARVMETNFLGMVRVNQQVLPLMREKGGGKNTVNRQFCAAAHKRRQQNRHLMVTLAGKRTRRHNSRYAAPEPDQHRNKRTAGKPDLSQQLIHHKGNARHIAGILQN